VEPTPAAEVTEPAPESVPAEATQPVETNESTDGAPAPEGQSDQVPVESAPVTETVTQADPGGAVPQAAAPKPSLATRILQRLPGSHSVTAPTS
jgi:hypothetical protein